MSSTAALPYDEVLYPGQAYHHTHPDRLSVVGALFGLRPAPVESCRVLELGCCNGGNLLPMAYTLPGSEFFGIDLAPRPVEQGKAFATELGLSNLKLQAMDILDFPADAGPFDYIIAHGIYSWVPPVVREKMLAICGTQLAPHGIAYISYKTFPGSYVTATIQKMMRYQASRRPGATEEEILLAGLEMLRLVVNAKPHSDPYFAQLKWQLDTIERNIASPGGYAWVYYDLGVEISDPVYFHEFMARASAHGLQFLSETNVPVPPAGRYPQAANEVLSALGDDVVAAEQYADFLDHREFRRTLLCRADAVVDRVFSPERFDPLYAVGQVEPAAGTPVGEGMEKEEFLCSGGAKVTVDQPVVKAAFRRLGQAWPGSVSFGELLAALPGNPGEAPGAPAHAGDAGHLATVLLAMFRAGMLELTTRPPRLAVAVSERPVASARVRQQIEHGQALITTLWHEEMEIKDQGVRKLITLLDGTRDRAAMLRDLESWLETARVADPALPSPEWVEKNLEAVLLSFIRHQYLEA